MTSANADPTITSKRFEELSTNELHAILRLRAEVFVVEQDCAYLDIDGRDTEAGTVHHWIERDGRLAAYARVLFDPDGSTRIGRVVTDPADRGGGLSAHLVRHITEAGAGRLVLDAQSHLVGWYERLGYRTCGDAFIEDGIAHTPMERINAG
jgi:ElaA protein